MKSKSACEKDEKRIKLVGMSNFPYELEVLSNATQYQKWMTSEVAPHLGQRIIELGSGIGNLSQWLPRRELLAFTEADETLYQHLLKRFQKNDAEPGLQILRINLDHSFASQVASLNADTIISFNVMEHIKDDYSAFQEQVQVLKESQAKGKKRIVIVVPAHAYAYGSFDKLFEHFRRYEAKEIVEIFKKIDPKIKVNTWYFNLLSLPGWIFAGRVLKQTRFNPTQLKIVEKLIPFWKPLDRVIHQNLKLPLGQSLIAVVEV